MLLYCYYSQPPSSSRVVNLAEAWSLEPLGIRPINLSPGACHEKMVPDDTVGIWLCVDPELEVVVVESAGGGRVDSGNT